MISAERIQEMAALFWAETNEDWTQEWRDELTKDEAALVCRWDRDFEMGLSKMCAGFRATRIKIADGIELNDGCGQCTLRDACPGYYDGCFEAVNGTEREKTQEERMREKLIEGIKPVFDKENRRHNGRQ